jgi:hypothetical protein
MSTADKWKRDNEPVYTDLTGASDRLLAEKASASKAQGDQAEVNTDATEQQAAPNADQAGIKEGDSSGKPTPLKPNFANIPAELKSMPNWVNWRYLPPKSHGQKWRKAPFQPNGKTASTIDRSTWSRFEDCCAAYARGGFDGVGFVFDGEIGADGLCYCGVDFDACIENGKLQSLARSRIERLKTYTEGSVSRTGFHCVARAKPLDRVVKFDGVEIYTRARYFTFTGYSTGEIKDAPAEINALALEVRAKEAAAKQQKQYACSGSNGTPNAEVADVYKDVKPVQAFAHLDISKESLTEGIKNSWFETLTPELKDEVVDHALGIIATSTLLFELEADGGNNAEYFKLTTSVARSDAPHAEDIFVKHASTAKNADPEEELQQHFFRCRESEHPDTREITVGTLLGLAQQNGANFDQWKRQAPPIAPLPPGKRKPLKGGTYSRDEALVLMNSHYLIGKSDQEVSIFRIKDDGLLAFTPAEQFKLDVANIFVRLSAGSAKPIPVEKFWKESPRRHQRKIVFKPGSTTEPDEFNLWRGFGVEPQEGRQKQERLLQHVWLVICRRDKGKFEYLIRWLAFAVQNPDKHPGTIIVLKSRKQGTGKSTLGVVMLTIFGQHGTLIDDHDRLLGRFNDWVEPISFILAEEILWAGDHKTADKLKSRITANTLQIEHKGGAVRQIPNRLHLIMTTNHDHAVPAGVGDRRLVVYDVSEEHACDKTWFDPLYRDLYEGGFGEFLNFLQNVPLDDWHPRQILKTAEATEQQRMSGDSITQWSQACVEADAIVGDLSRGIAFEYALGSILSTEVLRGAYTAYCKQQNSRPANQVVFGQACAEMFGSRKRLSVSTSGAIYFEQVTTPPNETLRTANERRPWGYEVPDGETWQKKIDARLGIQS